MDSVSRYRRFADEAEKKAMSLTDAKAREGFRALAEQWRRLADAVQAERRRRVEPLNRTRAPRVVRAKQGAR